MRMNTNIPMQGQQVDVVNALSRGHQAGRMARQADIFQQHGAGIAAGDPNAINALAQFDPQQALAAKGQHQQMAARSQQMKALDARERRAIEQQAAQLSAAERAAAAEEVRQGLMRGIGLYKAGDLEGLNGLLTSVGEQPLQSIDQFVPVAARYKEVFDTLLKVEEFGKGPEDPAAMRALRMRAQEAGLQPNTPEYEQFMLTGGKAADGLRITSNPDGGLTVEQGGAVTRPEAPKLTVEAGKNTGFMIRMRESNQTLNDLENQGTRFAQQNLEAVPLGIGNYFRDEDFQKFDQARRDFVNALLRRESGAVISEQEFDNANKQYFPMPGDGPEVIAQKKRNRETAIQGIEIGSGEGAAYVDQLNANEQAANPFANMPIDELNAVDFSNMTLEQINAWNRRMDEVEQGQ